MTDTTDTKSMKYEFTFDIDGANPETKLADLTLSQYTELLAQYNDQLAQQKAAYSSDPENIKKITQMIQSGVMKSMQAQASK